MDANATLAVGPFSHPGKSRVATQAGDHDFKPTATVTPVGSLLPASADLFRYGVSAPVTSDGLVDCLSRCWETMRDRFPALTTRPRKLDQGPETQRRRTQFMARIVDFVRRYQLTVQLTDYPPYPSKYNPIERCWGALEQPWHGSLLDAVAAGLHLAKTMTCKGLHPLVDLVTTTYPTGVKLTKQAMTDIEAPIVRLTSLDKGFVTISPSTVWGT